MKRPWAPAPCLIFGIIVKKNLNLLLLIYIKNNITRIYSQLFYLFIE